MSHFSKHCSDCEEKLGASYDYVHRWLDEYAKSFFPSAAHRQYRHHSEGIEEVRKMWGDDAAKAAKIHILDDMGFIPDKKWYNSVIEVVNDPRKGPIDVYGSNDYCMMDGGIIIPKKQTDTGKEKSV